jgi:hypothetical protein
MDAIPHKKLEYETEKCQQEFHQNQRLKAF